MTLWNANRDRPTFGDKKGHGLNHPLRIQICPKKGISPIILFFSDGIGTLIPVRSGGVWILRDLEYIPSFIYLDFLSHRSLAPNMWSNFIATENTGPKNPNFGSVLESRES